MSIFHRFRTRHPLDFIPSGWWPRFFWPLLILTTLLMGVFSMTGASLNTEAAPYGVVSLELAGTVDAFSKMVASWDETALNWLYFGLGLDFLFIVVYASTIAFGCGITANHLDQKGWPLARWGNLMAWGVILAAILDVIENTILLVLLNSVPVSPLPQIAHTCAVVKFGLVFIGMVYIIYGGAVILVERIPLREEE